MKAQQMHLRIRRLVLDPSSTSGARRNALASAIETELLPWASGKPIAGDAVTARCGAERPLASAVAGAIAARLDATPLDACPHATGARNG
jgi:hypothetical protein